ncbi:hypothetical protein EMPS_11636 [Entomortierella parvispora]|uniref:Uncharacterized protein n=1 Tax=Entomortierella parvispora TaxID=205924 RepID=A0A9P3HM22_9FUNG|nr:hypothetical protein EMPS_11636 [Entomortierella parvispora]
MAQSQPSRGASKALVRMTLTTSIISAEERPMPEEGPRAALATFLSSVSAAQGSAPSQTRAYDTLPVVPSSVASAVSIKSSSSTAGAPLYAFGQSSRAGALHTHKREPPLPHSLKSAWTRGPALLSPLLCLHKKRLAAAAVNLRPPRGVRAGQEDLVPVLTGAKT